MESQSNRNWNPRFTDVKTAFSAVPNYGRSVEYDANFYIDIVGHLQGMARYGVYDIFTRSISIPGYDYGTIIVVNRITQKLVHELDTIKGYGNHPGGCQVIGDYLAVPIETYYPGGTGNNGSVRFYWLGSMTDTTEPTLLPTRIIIPDKRGAGAVGITDVGQDSSRHYVLGVYDDGAVTIMKSSGGLLNEATCTFTPVFNQKLSSQGADNISLITAMDESVYMISFTSTDDITKDWVYLWKVDLVGKRFELVTGIDNPREMYPESNSKHLIKIFGPHFRYGAGLQIVSEQKMAFYCCERNPDVVSSFGINLDINNFGNAYIIDHVQKVSVATQGRPDNATDVFIVRDDGSLYSRHFDDTWSGWTKDFNNAPKLKLITSVPYEPDLFAIGEDYTLYHCNYDSNTKNWSTWSTNFNGAPKLYDIFPLFNTTNNVINLFAITEDFTILHCTFINGIWSPWKSNFPYTGQTNIKFKKIFSLVNKLNGNTEVFGIGQDNKLYHCYFNLNGQEKKGWHGWVADFQNPNYKKFGCIDVFGTTNGHNDFPEIFIIDGRDELLHSYFDGHTWAIFTPFLLSSPNQEFKLLNSGYCISDTYGISQNVELFGIYENKLYYNYFNGSSWQSWKPFNPVPGITSITGHFDDNRKLDLFAVGEKGTIYHCYSTGLNGKALTWSEWESW